MIFLLYIVFNNQLYNRIAVLPCFRIYLLPYNHITILLYIIRITVSLYSCIAVLPCFRIYLFLYYPYPPCLIYKRIALCA